MQWDKLLSAKRLGQENKEISNVDEIRSQFQRDYDRIIFSSPFRRLQNKTQVFPLPGSVFVHNRLTHSLEVASVGRSLANLVALELKNKSDIKHKSILDELGSIVSAACLAHDLGNPPFGHAGEDAISRFFSQGKGLAIKEQVSANEWLDLTSFEGNANALRLLTHQFNGRRKGGFALTYSTLAALIKYPHGSDALSSGKKKYGYFQSEKETFIAIANELGLKKKSENPICFARHPLVFLVEAADDICYEIMDIEDAHKLKILSTQKTFDLLLGFFDTTEDSSFYEQKEIVFKEVTDINEQVSYLRASVISKLIKETADVFIAYHDQILEGEYNSNLIKDLQGNSKIAFEKCKNLAIKEIYNHPSVVKIELSGFNVLGTLLDEFITALIRPDSEYSKKILSIIPSQFNIEDQCIYKKTMAVVDFVSGMTDLYAVDLYKDIKGINL
ncbi:MAG: dehydrogenase [Bacteroidetes bacterium GWF2_33_16]|nr:MAG: dehydrogenase [Bacteroidetes bacterium GWE2_32_14]OFY04809.1 MAG: dehydrogenase [Bacteroidetes bacterium GWF2_33_16]